jgi:5,10-methylenetetrahydrofolate reductase
LKVKGFIVRGRTQQAGSSNKPKSRSKSRDRKPNKFCRYCKADNHVISRCTKLKNKQERQKKKEADKSADEASIVENSDGRDALIITFNDEKRMTWVLDSACSFHIC